MDHRRYSGGHEEIHPSVPIAMWEHGLRECFQTFQYIKIIWAILNARGLGDSDALGMGLALESAGELGITL